MSKKQYTIEIQRFSFRNTKDRTVTGTLDELIEYFSYTLQKGKSWEHERGNKRINLNPRTIGSLVNNLNNAEDNAAANGCANTYYKLVG